ncbi:MAG: GAF domain-containing protein [Elusimicrobiota bacterium]
MRKEPLDTLYDALEFLAAMRESNDIKVWSRLLEKTAAALDAPAGAYLYYDTLSRQLVPFCRLGDAPPEPDYTPVTIGEGLAGWVAKFHEPLLVTDTEHDARYDKDVDRAPGVEARSVMAIPLFVSLDFVGVFEYLSPRPAAFTPDDLKLVRAIAQQTSHTIRRLELENIATRVTTRKASIFDSLSGGFVAVDPKGRVMMCNPAARRMLKISGEPTTMPIEKALTEIPELAQVLRQTLSTKNTVKRQEIRWWRDGDPRLLGYSTLLIKDTRGTLAGVGATFQDITPSKQ